MMASPDLQATSQLPEIAERLIAVGVSLGGLAAIEMLLRGLALAPDAAMVIVQHRSRAARDGLAEELQRMTRVSITEAEDKESIRGGRVYLAPSDYHLLIEGREFALSTEGPVAHARPSIDVLFESAAEAYEERLIGVILTGTNHDGARGAVRVKERGGTLIVQDPATAVGKVMPRAALAAAKADSVLPLEAIPGVLWELTHRSEATP